MIALYALIRWIAHIRGKAEPAETFMLTAMRQEPDGELVTIGPVARMGLEDALMIRDAAGSFIHLYFYRGDGDLNIDIIVGNDGVQV